MPATANMVVQTESPKVIAARRMVIQLLLASGNHNCAVRGSDGRNWTDVQMAVQRADSSPELCPVWGDCRLQDFTDFYPAQHADHAILALEHDFPAGFSLRAEGYLKDYDRLRPRDESLFDPLSLVPELRWDRVRIEPTSANARGFEVLLTRRSNDPGAAG